MSYTVQELFDDNLQVNYFHICFCCKQFLSFVRPMFHDFKSCPKPCKTVKTQVSKSMTSGLMEQRNQSRIVTINFKSTVEVFKSVKKINVLAVINDVGSSMGLWLGVSAFSIFKLLQDTSYNWGFVAGQRNFRQWIGTSFVILISLTTIALALIFFHLSASI